MTSVAEADNMSPADLLEIAEDLLDRRDLDAALKSLERAECCGVDRERCAAGRWRIHMLRGNFSAAWAESDAIRARRNAGAGCLWRGEDIAGKRVMVRCLHGFGDAVQFFRYAPRLKAIAGDVIWQVQPELLDIARCFRGVEQVITWEQEAEWEVQVEIMELACIFRTRLHELPVATNYLHLPGSVVGPVAAQIGFRNTPRVGLVWSAGEWNRSRSIPFELFHPILDTTGCEFWNLQGGAARWVSQKCPRSACLRDAEPCWSGILRLAAVIAQLDLVITVDTLAAHLAGSLGVPAWVMLQHAADWRWMTRCSDSPWYPSLLLFRQREPGDWVSVLRDVEGALRRWLDSESEGWAA